MTDTAVRHDPLTPVLASFRSPLTTDFDDAWIGMEPTFQTARSVRKWRKMSARQGGADAYFEDPYMLKTQRKVAKAIHKRYESERSKGRGHCFFARVELDDDRDQWDVRRQNLLFHWEDENLEPFEVRVSLDPETFEYSIKPVPLIWCYDPRFATFLEEFLWQVPHKLGLSASIAHGGAQFSLSAKTMLQGSLLADVIADRLNHPELATWIMDWPNPDERALRATIPRREAFGRILRHYWSGDFHPQSIGVLTAENAYLDLGFGPVPAARDDLMDTRRGPVGSPRDVFQTNFAFGRSVRNQAQYVHPGYWQSAHPDEDGYRPDQIMRYSENNINRLQIAGELHVKSDKVLEPDRIPELSAPLELSMLTTEASWEYRAHMGRTSARDYLEAVLLDVHHAQYLLAHPHVAVSASLAQDQILGDAEQTLLRHGGGQTLDRLHREARRQNLEDSRGRVKSDWIEPETLFWAAWQVLPTGEKAAVAREAIGGFVERVEQAASVDPRGELGDLMEWHRHRIHPELWKALDDAPRDAPDGPVQGELRAWQAKREEYLARRPCWSQLDSSPPWVARQSVAELGDAQAP